MYKTWKKIDRFTEYSSDKLAELVMRFLNKNGIQPNEVLVVSSGCSKHLLEQRLYWSNILVYSEKPVETLAKR